MKTKKQFLVGASIFFIFFSIALQYILLKLFPSTGLARIGSVPITFLISLLIVYLFVFVAKKTYLNKYISFILTFIIICFTHIELFPQEENGVNVWKHLNGYYSAYQNYENINEDALYYPITIDKWHSNKKIFATYIAALHKYHNSIPLDGNYSIYLDHLKTTIINDDGYDPIIKDKKDITSKMSSGAEKLFYKILDFSK